MPMGLDIRLPDDTLFMVFEEDFRFFPDGQDPDKADDYRRRVAKVVTTRGVKALVGSGSLPPQTQGASSSQGNFQSSESLPPQGGKPFNVFGSPGKSTDKGKSTGKGGGKPKVESRFMGSASRGCSNMEDEQNEGFSSNVSDLVRWATVAHRKGMGNMVWVGWVPEKGKPSRLSHGSHLIMVSKQGLSHLAKAFLKNEIRRGHIDLVLKEWLMKGQTAARVKASYVWPSMGGFFAHASGCDPKNFGAHNPRESNFDKQKPAVGTRVGTDPHQRGKWLIQFAEAWKDRVWKECPSDADLVDKKWRWLSIREPTASVPAALTQPSPLQQGPTQDGQNPDEAKNSKRYKRTKRQFEKREGLRHWTTTPEEAAVVPQAFVFLDLSVSIVRSLPPSFFLCIVRSLPPSLNFFAFVSRTMFNSSANISPGLYEEATALGNHSRLLHAKQYLIYQRVAII